MYNKLLLLFQFLLCSEEKKINVFHLSLTVKSTFKDSCFLKCVFESTNVKVFNGIFIGFNK